MIPEKALALSQLARQIKASLSASFNSATWVVAEIQEMNMHRTGHCYMELVEKDPESGRLLAKTRATIWASAFRMIRPYFETTTGYELAVGMKVMFSVGIEFHEVFGFSLNIRNIDPNYTMGDIARKRQETITQLKADGIYEMNKDLTLPDFPQKIAIISSASAAGYGDFMDQLLDNGKEYVFYTTLFEATMQGDRSAESVVQALERVYAYEELFDAVVIIRGGGSKSDLSAFDEYEMAAVIAQFPLPVLTGIGHDRDESVADLVAFNSLKTPTAVAEFLVGCIDPWIDQLTDSLFSLKEASLGHLAELKKQVDSVSVRLMPLVQSRLQSEKERVLSVQHKLEQASASLLLRERLHLEKTTHKLQQVSSLALNQQSFVLQQLQTKLQTSTNSFLQNKKQHVHNLEKTLEHLDPVNTLKRGFSVTFVNGKPLCSTSQIKKGNIIVTRLPDGDIESTLH